MLSKFSVKRPYTVVVAVVLVLILGAVSFMNLQTDMLPSIDLPYVIIMTSYPGASPEEVELVVTKPIEQIVATTNNIKNVSSISRESSSIVILEFNNDVNMDSATIEINGNLELIKSAWNDSVSSPMVIRINPDMMPVMVSSVDVEGMDITGISRFVRESIIPELESVNGVASVTGEGLLEESLEVLISRDKLEQLNTDILRVIDADLAEAEEQLKEAQQELAGGKAQLAAENNKQSAEIARGEEQITQALTQMTAAEKMMTAGEEELLQAQRDLEISLSVIQMREQELVSQEQALLALGENITREQRVQLVSVQQGLEAVSAQKTEMNAALNEVEFQLSSLQAEMTELLQQKSELENQKKQLEQGKELLDSEMRKAQAKLTDGERKLNEQLEGFDKAREEAFANASLDGVITPEMITGILAAQNFSMPAGYVTENGTEYLVKVGEKIKDVDELKNLFLFDTQIDGVGKIYLNDVADVAFKNNADELYAKVNGNDAVILMFQKQSNFSTTEVAKSLRNKMDTLMRQNQGLSITSLMDQGVYIDIVVDSVLDNLLYGGLLAVLILILFLRNIKPTVVIAVSIPISLVFAVAMMYFSGVTINVISLAGLALGVGMLVDNSIVVIENIFRMKNEGKSAARAAVEGANEVAGAIFASTLTTACVFLPIVFTKGISRQLFSDMGLTIAYSLFASLIVAVTLVPTMASSLLKGTTVKEYKTFAKVTGFYENVLIWSLKHKAAVMAFVVLLLVVSGYLAAAMGTTFLPDMDAPQMSVSIEMPKDSTMDETIAMSDTVIERISAIDDIDTIGAFQNQGFGGFGPGGNADSMSLYLVLKENRTSGNKEIEKEILALTEELDCTVNVSSNNMDMTALGGSGIEVIVKGRELDTLHEVAVDVAAILEQTEGAMEVSTGTEEGLTEMRITVDKEKAMENGLTVAQVFTQVNTLINQGKTATTLTEAAQDYPVIVVDSESRMITRNDLADMTIKQAKNGAETEVRLGDIAGVAEGISLSSIRREAQERYMSVTAGIDPDHNIGLVSRELTKKLDDYQAPEGYTIEIAGETEMINESLMDLIYMLLLAVVFIYLIMVAQFQSLLSPFIVMFTIPLAFTGGLLALYVTGYEISLIAMLGFLVLSGVVVNNGIVFVDYTNQLRDTGLNTNEALIAAGRTRMRPILMTAITTILGLSTLSFGVGTGAEMLQPLAIVAIGGLTYATLLTLLVVPVMYSLLHQKRIRRTLVEGVDF